MSEERNAIVDTLRGRVLRGLQAGTLGTGDRLPSDRELAAPPPQSPYFFRRMGTMIARGFTRPALHRPMFTDAPAFGNQDMVGCNAGSFRKVGVLLRGMGDLNGIAREHGDDGVRI